MCLNMINNHIYTIWVIFEYYKHCAGLVFDTWRIVMSYCVIFFDPVVVYITNVIWCFR